MIATSYGYIKQLPDVFKKSVALMLYRVGARTDLGATPFANRVKNLVYSNSIMKLIRWLEVSICYSFTRKP